MEILAQCSRRHAEAALTKVGSKPSQQLTNALCVWLGPFVTLLREGQHGEEFLGIRSSSKKANPLADTQRAIAEFLINSKV